LHIAVSNRNHIPAEQLVHGADLGLPLVETLGAIRSHSASRITWHAHKRFELLFLLEGATAYEFTGGRTLDLPGGHFLVIPPHTRHRGTHDVRMPANLCGMVFDLRHPAAGRHTPFSARDLDWMAGLFTQHALTVQPMGVELRRLATTLSRQVVAFRRNDKKPLPVISLRMVAGAALIETARQLTGTAHAKPQRAIAAAIAYLEQNYQDLLPMAELARVTGYGRARLFHLFKQSTGMTPNDYLQRLRVNKARELLTCSTRTVTDIAHATGFSSSQYFSNVFRKYAGTTPSRFRSASAAKIVKKKGTQRAARTSV
jgi:AraC-like DNA-binding protein